MKPAASEESEEVRSRANTGHQASHPTKERVGMSSAGTSCVSELTTSLIIPCPPSTASPPRTCLGLLLRTKRKLPGGYFGFDSIRSAAALPDLRVPRPCERDRKRNRISRAD